MNTTMEERVNPESHAMALQPSDEKGLHVRVSAVMTCDPVCVTDDLSAEAAAALLLERGQCGVPVIDAQGRLLGMVSLSDLLRAQQTARDDGGRTVRVDDEPLDPSMHAVHAFGPSVGEVMTPLAFSVGESTELSRAAALMASEGVQQLPVVSAQGVVKGVLTALDVMAWVALLDGHPLQSAPRSGRVGPQPVRAR